MSTQASQRELEARAIMLKVRDDVRILSEQLEVVRYNLGELQTLPDFDASLVAGLINVFKDVIKDFDESYFPEFPQAFLRLR